MPPLRRLLPLLLVLAIPAAGAGPLRDWLATRHSDDASLEADDDGGDASALPASTRALRDLAYGTDARQRLDAYLPAGGDKIPLVVMVHGGGWRHGDKASGGVVAAKAAHWLPRGIGLVSVNYRLLPDATPLQQAQDVAAALAFVQAHAAQWGADPDRIVLMGHSAGAHLVSLIAADPAQLMPAGSRRWLGTVALDSAAVDVPAVMQRRHLPLYDAAFGSDPATWRALSPRHRLGAGATPLLLVCSSTRRDRPCDQARDMVAAAKGLKVRAEMLPQPLSHRDINVTLGQAGPYTAAVDAFLASLDPALAQRLPR